MFRVDPLATAFALWNLLLTRQPQWNRLIYVDDETFVKMINYLESTQDNSLINLGLKNIDARLSGSWNISYPVDRRFSPFINSSKWSDSIDRECFRRVPSTAMIVIAMKSSTLPSGVGADKAEKIVSEALRFLSRHILQVDDLFSQLIATYALRLALDATSQHKISQ